MINDKQLLIESSTLEDKCEPFFLFLFILNTTCMHIHNFNDQKWVHQLSTLITEHGVIYAADEPSAYSDPIFQIKLLIT